MADIEKKYLAGLVYKDAKREETEEDGATKVSYVPFKRPLTPDDVLAVREEGNTIIFSTKDGQKYTVAKTGKDKE